VYVYHTDYVDYEIKLFKQEIIKIFTHFLDQKRSLHIIGEDTAKEVTVTGNMTVLSSRGTNLNAELGRVVRNGLAQF
jgi:hypothetical protein